ncbi:MAG: ABC transporter ATP-binding protein [Candidatus Eremiobacteraeota bacterium]|nr:ABC transporter ATP-binding protein [Candidatus Eremiobacteraeota bacterium]MBC5826698.1 ABC transporter ATP-binding protein [Candidatus Eremiobacteraeota bacterium]
MRTVLERDDRDPTQAAPPDNVEIRLHDVELRFGQKIVLSGCSLDCERGKVTCVIGMSGAGKSTILRVINGLRRPYRGLVYIDGKEISGLPERELIEVRKKMGFAFQYSALFDSMTIADNVAFPLHEHTSLTRTEIGKRVSEVLASLGLEDVGDRLPSELSGGMQKRVGFARAIVNDPKILLFDEPTSGLDPIIANVITDTIRDIHSNLGATCVVVSHDLNYVYSMADTIAMLFEGTIIESGPADKIRNSPNPLVQQFLQGSVLGPIPI